MATAVAEKGPLGLENPMGTDGFEFVEYAAPDPELLRDQVTVTVNTTRRLMKRPSLVVLGTSGVRFPCPLTEIWAAPAPADSRATSMLAAASAHWAPAIAARATTVHSVLESAASVQTQASVVLPSGAALYSGACSNATR